MYRIPFLLLLLLPVSASLLRAQDSAGRFTADSLMVVVTDASSLEPLAGADVELLCGGVLQSSAVTDTVGVAGFPLSVDTGREIPAEETVAIAPWPNPFERTTRFSLDVTRGGTLVVEVYDLLGRLVADLSREVQAGRWEAELDLSGLCAGSYVVSVGISGRRLPAAVVAYFGTTAGAPGIYLRPTGSLSPARGAGKAGDNGSPHPETIECEIRVSAAGYVGASLAVDMASGGSVGVALERDPNVFINSIGMEFKRIQAGTFQMGSDNGDDSNERPVHQVTITRDFYMGTYEVSQGQWAAVMGTNPSYFTSCGSDCPVESVDWYHVIGYANALSMAEGLTPCYDSQGNVTGGSGGDICKCEGYRLPTEAEWEYAARAGTTTEYSFGDNVDQLGQYAWYSGNSEGRTHPVGQKGANPWGLYDVHGNVWEWVQDWFRSSYYESSPASDPQGPSSAWYRVLRGGGWYRSAATLRSAFRFSSDPDGSGWSDPHYPSGFGFRLLRPVH